jgi:2-dehydro-3-deoxygluconokinase
MLEGASVTTDRGGDPLASEKEMSLKLRKQFAYSLVVPTSIGVRITPLYAQPVHTSSMFYMHATSAETNAASVSSYLGLPVRVLTNFVKGSPIARLIQNDLRARGMTFEGPEVEQGGPWGYRHQFNIADSGWGSRGPRVHNDRAGEVGRTLNAKDFNLRRLFNKDGVQMLHLSGLIAALSPETGAFCLALARAARRNDTRISFDLNYRKTMWVGREKQLRAMFTQIARAADVLVGNEEDFQECLGVPGPEAGFKKKNLRDQIPDFQAMMDNARKSFPNAQILATTLREEVSANSHLWGAILSHAKDAWEVIEPREIGVLDRIGGGDGFVGGLLYALLKGWPDPSKWIEFGWKAGALAATMFTDYAQPADEDQVWRVGAAKVVR